VFCTGIGTAKRATAFNRLYEIYKAEAVVRPLTDEAVRLLSGLTCTTNPLQLLRILADGVTKNINEVLPAVQQNAAASDVLWDYMQQTPEQVVNSKMLSEYLDTMTNQWMTPEQMNKFRELRERPDMNSKQTQSWLEKLEAAARERGKKWPNFLQSLRDFISRGQYGEDYDGQL